MIRSSEAPLGRPLRAITMALALVLGTAATVGDIGSCGQAVDPLDAPKFFAVKAAIDCSRCGECSLASALCREACDGTPMTSFAPGCEPLVHDGEVCLHQLIHATCDDYASYVDDARPTAPSECQFCPRR